MKMRHKNVVKMLTLLIVLSASPFFGLHANSITIERSITWVKVGDRWDPLTDGVNPDRI